MTRSPSIDLSRHSYSSVAGANRWEEGGESGSGNIHPNPKPAAGFRFSDLDLGQITFISKIAYFVELRN